MGKERSQDLSLGLPFTMEEIEYAINGLPDNKAYRHDGCPIDTMKYVSSDESLTYWLHLYNGMLRTSTVPPVLKKVCVVPIYKKGDPADCDCYRGLSITDHMGKALQKHILNRINKYLNSNPDILIETQYGFCADRSTTDAMSINRLVTASSKYRNTPIYKCFIDLTKAYDKVDRELLWTIL